MKKLELDEQARKEHDARLNREKQKRYRESIEQIKVNMPKGTMERIKLQGYSANAFIKELVLKELDRLEGK